jgi:O-antigen ligase
MSNRNFSILLLWLFLAPVVSNLINAPNANPFFQVPSEYHRKFIDDEGQQERIDAYFVNESEIEVRRWAEPTRFLFVSFIFLFFLNSLTKQQRMGPFDNVEYSMVLFSILILSSAYFQSNNHIYSLRTAIDGFIVPFLAYFTCRRLATSPLHLIRLSKTFLYMAVYLIFLGFIERAVHPEPTYRLSGPFRDKGAIYIATSLPFFIALIDTMYLGSVRTGTAIVSRGTKWIILSLAPLIIILTLTRANWVGFLMALAVLIATGCRLLHVSRKVIALGLTLTLLPLVVMLFLSLAPVDALEQRAGNLNTIYGRIATWIIALDEFKQAPLFGIGLNNLRDVLNESEFDYQGINRYRSAHNSYIALLVEQGLVGLLAYFAIVIGIMRKGLRFNRQGTQLRERWWGVAILTVMTAYLCPSMFSTKLHITNSLPGVFVFALVGSIIGVYGRPRLTVYVQRSPRLAVKPLAKAQVYDQ